MFYQSMPVIWWLCIWWWSRACERLLTCLPYNNCDFFFPLWHFFLKEGSTFFIVLVMVTPNCGAFIFFLECTFEFSILQFFFPWLLIHVPWVEPAQIACSDRTLGRFLDLLKSTILYLLGVFFFCKRLKLIS